METSVRYELRRANDRGSSNRKGLYRKVVAVWVREGVEYEQVYRSRTDLASARKMLDKLNQQVID